MSRYPRRSKIRRRSREGARQTAVAVAMAALLALGLLQIREYVIPHQRAIAGQHAVVVIPSDDEIYTGSILFTPIEGRICHQFLFDNRTGRISDNGNVDCEGSQYRADPKNWGFARARAIGNSFHDR